MTGPRVRYAPSPTGDIHVGNMRSGLFNYLFSRAKGGTFILRIEDTDKERSTPESVSGILEGLAWLGITIDEGPYLQSDRVDRHRERMQELLDGGAAYRCTCPKERLDVLRADAERAGRTYRYDGHCRERAEAPPAGVPFVIRAKIPHSGEVVVDDVLKGRVVISNEHLDDFILARPDGSPVYNFVVVVDDIDMGITHVIRGDDHLSNTPKQIHLYHLFGAPLPVFAHLPMVNGPDGKKLAKRHGATSVLACRDQGILPETLLSFLARLGWSHGDQELFTMEELCRLFDLSGCGTSAGVFDFAKLTWQNGVRIREMAPMELLARTRPFLEARRLSPDEPWLPRAVAAIQERANTLVEAADRLAPFYRRGPVEMDPAAEAKFLTPESRARLGELADAIEGVEPFRAPELEAAVGAFLAERDLKMKHLGQPLRVAITGVTASPSIFDCLEIFGREVSLARLHAAAAGRSGGGGSTDES